MRAALKYEPGPDEAQFLDRIITLDRDLAAACLDLLANGRTLNSVAFTATVVLTVVRAVHGDAL